MMKQLAILSGSLLLDPWKMEWSESVVLRGGEEASNIVAFADTIVPGAGTFLKEVLNEKFYGFKRFKLLLLADLRFRSKRIHGVGSFRKLNPSQRSEVIADAIRSGGTIRRLYSGAIQILQLGFYTGYMRQPEGCDDIGFASVYDYRPTSHPESELFFGRELTNGGNLS